MSDFKIDLSKFSKDKLIELRNNAEKVKENEENGKNSSANFDADINNIFNNTEEITTENMILSLSGGNNINQIQEEDLAEYNLYANLMANGDESITKDETLSFASLDGNTSKISQTDFQNIINDYDVLLDEIDTSIKESILTDNKMNVINSGAEYDLLTGTYSVKVENYTNSKVDDGQGGKRYCNGSLWGITENVYGSNVDKATLYKYIQKMNPQIKDINLINDGDTIKLPILKYDNDGKIIGYDKTDITPQPTVPTDNTNPTVPTEETTPTLPTIETNPTVPTEETNPTISTEDTTPTIVEEETTPTLPTENTTPTIPTEETMPTVPTEETRETQGPTMPTEPTIPEKKDGILMGGNISGDKYQGKTISKYEMYFESNLASFNKEFDANGKLDKAAYQGRTGDCVLISGCYALASNEKGNEIINDMITVNKNASGEIESYTVKFKGLDEEYTITDKELKSKTKPKLSRLLGNFAKYAGGDEDMTLIELAFQKCAKETKSDKVNFESHEKKLNGIYYDTFYTVLTGKSCEYSTPKEFITNLENESLSSNTVGQMAFDKSIKVKESEW